MVQTVGGPLREVFRTTADEVIAFQDWTADGHILFTKAAVSDLENKRPLSEPRVVGTTGAAARDTGIRIPGNPHKYYVSLRPDGKELCLHGRRNQRGNLGHGELPAPAPMTRQGGFSTTSARPRRARGSSPPSQILATCARNVSK